MEALEELDRAIFIYFNGLRADWLDMPMWYISTALLWIPLFLFFIYYAYKKGQWTGILFLVVGAALCIALADLTSAKIFKVYFQRYRPTHNLEIMDIVQTVIKPNGEEYRGGLYSFVSSHAANYFAIATYIYLSFKKYHRAWVFLFFWAALIAYSRIYLGVHYPSDLIAGGLLGFGIGHLVFFLRKKISDKFVKA